MRNLSYLIGLFLIFSISGHASPDNFYAQASQDAFVYTLLYDIEQKADKGYYLEIGSADPINISNTYFLEKNLNWKGVSIDIAIGYKGPWLKARQNPLMIADATSVDYSFILQSFPKVIDYLSLDVDGQYDTVLKKIPFDEYTFKIITIEHDFYRYGDIYRKKEREFLTSHGYYLLCPDVSHPAVGSFEDWWIHPSAFSEEALIKLTSFDLEKKYHDEIVSLLNLIKR